MQREKISVVLVAHGYVPDSETATVWAIRGVYNSDADPYPMEIPGATQVFGPCYWKDGVDAQGRVIKLLEWLGYEVTEATVADD
jgi:hypothetical protein